MEDAIPNLATRGGGKERSPRACDVSSRLIPASRSRSFWRTFRSPRTGVRPRWRSLCEGAAFSSFLPLSAGVSLPQE